MKLQQDDRFSTPRSQSVNPLGLDLLDTLEGVLFLDGLEATMTDCMRESELVSWLTRESSRRRVHLDEVSL